MNLWEVAEVTKDIWEEERHCVAYWSWGSDEAVEHWLRTYPEQCYVEEVQYRVWRADPQPSSKVKADPHAERRPAVLREIGWRYDGDSQCESCELWSCDGHFQVCPECCCCDECGCECNEVGELLLRRAAEVESKGGNGHG